MIIRYDCRHFRSDVPCAPHKTRGVHCDECPYHDPIEERILIIKLDALGDVLRTTCILPGLKEKYPHARITWITKRESIPLFDGNPYVDRVFEVNEATCVLGTCEFDIVINLDAAPLSAMLAAMSKGRIKKGFGYDARGFVYPLNSEAEGWLLMGLFDDVKKANDKTYQSIMLDICGLNPSDYSIQYFLKPEEKEFAKKFAEIKGLKDNDTIIGLNTGAGRRWEKKKWTAEGFIGLIDNLHRKYPTFKMLLYGGPAEIERNKWIMSNAGSFVVDAGCNNSIRNFSALLDLSSVIVTGDTMALHLALAMKKKTVALIGPTSSSELDLYGFGVKITADLQCLCCYKMKCDKEIDCMNSIQSRQVMEVIEKLL